MNYSRGETVNCLATIVDEDNVNITPSTIMLKIFDPSGILQLTKYLVDLTKKDTGIYYYSYLVEPDAVYGDWRYEYTISITDETRVVSSQFTISDIDSAVYCSVKDVARLMGGISITSATTPSFSDVVDVIKMHEDEIDHYTHHAWRSALIENEHYNFDGFVAQLERFGDWSDRARTHLKHRKIRAFIPGTHKIEIWDGQSWVDFVVEYTEGRGDDWWFDYERGVLHFSNRYPWRMRHSIRLTYAYGEDTVHGDIKKACTMLTAAYLLQGEDYTVLLPEGSSNIPMTEKSMRWQDIAYKLLDRHVELTSW